MKENIFFRVLKTFFVEIKGKKLMALYFTFREVFIFSWQYNDCYRDWNIFIFRTKLYGQNVRQITVYMIQLRWNFTLTSFLEVLVSERSILKHFFTEAAFIEDVLASRSIFTIFLIAKSSGKLNNLFSNINLWMKP